MNTPPRKLSQTRQDSQVNKGSISTGSRRNLLLLALLFYGLGRSLVAGEQPWPGVTVTRTALLRPNDLFGRFVAQGSVVSSNGCHTARVERLAERRYAVRRDGVLGAIYDKVSVPVFSQNGIALAYAAKSNEKEFVVFNEKVDESYGTLLPETLAVSADGKRYGYIVRASWRMRMVIDGKLRDVERWSPLELSPVFSVGGGKVAFAEVNRTEGKWRVVINGEPGEACDGQGGRYFKFSPDGSRWACTMLNRNKMNYIVDGVKGPEFDGVGVDFVFSPDSGRSAYVGRNGQDWFFVADGKIQQKIEGIVDHSITFSADGQHLAYAIPKKGGACIVLDGHPGPVFENLGSAFPPVPPSAWTSDVLPVLADYSAREEVGLLFSPDGHRMAFRVRDSGKISVMVDGKAQAVEIDNVLSQLHFSRNSQHLAYDARLGRASFVVKDGVKGAEYDTLGRLSLSDDGKHLAYVASKGNRAFVVLDERPSSDYGSIPAGPVFRTDGILEFMAADDKGLYRVEAKIER